MEDKIALTIEEAAESVGIGRTTAYRLCKSGEWPTIKIGRTIRIPTDGLRKWVAAGGTTTGRTDSPRAEAAR